MKHIKYILPAALLACVGAASLSSCDDMLDMGNDDVLYTDENTLTSANDTVNTFVGILYQLQKVAVRTNLFGELRGDLTRVYSNADASLQAIADFAVDSDNPYNNPRDYYAVINNCNYYLKNADTELAETRTSSSRDYHVLRAEWVAVRTIRAWLYLQLGQIYGSNIPVIEEPLLSIEDSESAFSDTGNRHDLQWICSHFIQDLEGYVDWFDYPYHGNPNRGGYSGSTPSRMSVLPIQLVLGDLYLWNASILNDPSLAKRAAEYYYKYLIWVPVQTGDGVIRNYDYKTINITGNDHDYWTISNGTYVTSPMFNFTYYSGGSYSLNYYGMSLQTYSQYYTGSGSFGITGDEVIAAIAMDSVAAADHFNELKYLYSLNSEDNQTPASLGPSQACYDYSDSQVYYDYYRADGSSTIVPLVRDPNTLSTSLQQQHFAGDMRIGSQVFSFTDSDGSGQQVITKSFNTRDVIIYRTADVYLRLCEALNTAGYPYFAKYILTLGLDQVVMDNLVLSQSDNLADSIWIQSFKFPRSVNGNYGFRTQLSETATDVNQPVNYYYYQGNTRTASGTTYRGFSDNSNVNMIGIHQRGSGNSFENPQYYPADADVIDESKADATKPVAFATYKSPSVSVEAATNYLNELLTKNPELVDYLENVVEPESRRMSAPVLDTDVLPVSQWPSAVQTYGLALSALSDSLQSDYRSKSIDWQRRNAHLTFARQQEVVDSLLDIESALETPFEGFRFGFLMRADYRCGGTGRKMGGSRTYSPGQYLSEHVGKRNSALQSVLMNRNKWFIGWTDDLTGATIGVK